MRRIIANVVFAVLLSFTSQTFAAPTQWAVADGGNGHWYEAFLAPTGISWSDASTAANGANGYLATITSPQENNFVFQLIQDESFWTDVHDFSGDLDGPWLGGFRPAGDWNWVTGEAFGYTNWDVNQPDGSGNRLHFHGTGPNISFRTPTWDDTIDDNFNVHGYVVESVPEPALSTLLFAAFTLLGGIRIRLQK